MLKKLIFTHNAFMDPPANFTVTLAMDGNYMIKAKLEYPWDKHPEREVAPIKPEDCKVIRGLIDDCNLWTWNKEYHPEGFEILDGFGWDLVYEDSGEIIGTSKNVIKTGGCNAYPWCFYKLIRAILIAVPELKDQLECYTEEKKPVY